MHSPYQKHLDTNYVPSIDEARHIQAILHNFDKEISELDAQAAVLQQELDVLQERRSTMHALSEQHRALLSPVRKLTRDILEEIFLACLPVDQNPSMSAIEAPMLLTRICSSWRQIAHSTPRIWAKIHISLPGLTLGPYGGEDDLFVQTALLRRIIPLQETAVKDWVSRSHACPLSISIYQIHHMIAPDLYDRHATVFEELQQMCQSLIRNSIIPHIKRWRDLDISVLGPTPHDCLDVLFMNERPQMLESLHVTHRISNDSTPLQYQWRDVVSLLTSHTTSATIHFFPVRESDMASISLQAWGNLTELNLRLDSEPSSGVKWAQFASSVLSQCHSLIGLKFSVRTFRRDEVFDHIAESVILRHLTTLSIHIPANRNALAFANSLCLPSLKNLDVGIPDSFHGNGNAHQEVEIIKTLIRTSDDFHTLKIYAPRWLRSVDDLVQLLKFIPTLRSLKVTPNEIKYEKWLYSRRGEGPQIFFRHLINDNLLQALMPANEPNSEIICPRLEEFECDYNLVTGITGSCLKEFVVSRQSDEHVSSLRRISVFINEPKQHGPANAEKVPLGVNSAVYFRRISPISYSPFDGLGKNPQSVDRSHSNVLRGIHVRHLILAFMARNRAGSTSTLRWRPIWCINVK